MREFHAFPREIHAAKENDKAQPSFTESWASKSESRVVRALSGHGHGLEPITQSVRVSALQSPFLALALAGFDQVLHAPRALGSGRATLRAAPISLHPKLILPLPGNRQVGELVSNRFSHFSFFDA